MQSFKNVAKRRNTAEHNKVVKFGQNKMIMRIRSNQRNKAKKSLSKENTIEDSNNGLQIFDDSQNTRGVPKSDNDGIKLEDGLTR